ncbi:DUF1700 domain-containing protein [Subdoligranulum variabile]|uniref:DUF4097 domain-containing protein n=1 Tax=Subdoligranulum variabile DSM 15176 TaxID=411471 RepID=D1PMT2_9FIRM|nr:DUF1700 domain-containing protein [Subdoligranulum variabile]EFB75867.1 hypothetical protein SUBVAR_05646 [Subdoligranulum variabile DSM 15176]UWP68538.1 DUF1700 domain-containing protein [Subdoligranulum variabile]
MRKYAYLARLEELLTALPAEERQEALNYYEEYFDAAGNENEEKTAEELGDPSEVARKILEGEGIDLQDVPEETGTPKEELSDPTAPQLGEKVSAAPPAGPEPPKLEEPAQYTTRGTSENPPAQKRGKRRLWIIYWLLIVLALAIQISALLFGLRGFSNRGGDTASVAVSAVPSVEEPEVTPIPTAGTGLAAEGSVTYSGVLDAPGKGTLFVNLTRGNVVFRTGDQASVEVRNVDVGHNVNYGKTVDYGYAFVCDSTDPNTHVTITLPSDAFERLEVHISNSGAIELGELHIRQIDAFTASGPIQSGCLQTEDLNVVTDIGNVWLEKISNGADYQMQNVCIQAPHGYVAANFSAPRNEWKTNITAPDGMVESTVSASSETVAARSLEVVAASTVNLKYGV